MKPVMLALSTFRYSENPIKLAVEKAKASGKLAMVYVVDVNLARYMVGSDIGFFSDLKERCEKEILEEHRKQAEGRVARIAGGSASRGHRRGDPRAHGKVRAGVSRCHRPRESRVRRHHKVTKAQVGEEVLWLPR